MVFVGLLLLLLAYCPDIVLTQHYYEDYDDTNSQIMEMYQKFGSHLFASPDYESGKLILTIDINYIIFPSIKSRCMICNINYYFPRN